MKRIVLLVFDDIIAYMEANQKLSLKVTKLFLREREINILLAFISKSYLKVPKTIRLDETQYFIMKILNKQELRQIASKFR